MRFLGSNVPTPLFVLATTEILILAAITLLLHAWLLPEFSWISRIISSISMSAVCFASMFAMGVYESRRREGYVAMMLRTAVALFLIALVVISLIAAVIDRLAVMQSLIAYAMGLGFLWLAAWRALFSQLMPEKRFRKRVMVLGSGKRAHRIASRTRRQSDQKSFSLIGFAASPSGEEAGWVSDMGYSVFSTVGSSLLALCESLSVDELVVALDDSMARSSEWPFWVIDQLNACRLHGVLVIDAAEFIEREQNRLDLELLDPSQIALGPSFSMDARRVLLKRGFDLVAATLLLALLWPLMIVTALAVFLESGGRGTVLLRQERVGLRGQPFTQFKFRSMVENAEPTGPTWTRPNDARITRVGAIIRTTRLDEFPQLFNVLRGEMSFVGPRPERTVFVRQFEAQIPLYSARHLVKPGITGWAQLKYPYGASAKDAREKLQYDLYYLKRQSVLFDLIIMLQTVEVIVVGEGAR
ncbi:MAG: TIGR03013 family XrtA/PEP-CTERM system glycosyltransferase [Pseudomonadales bacterium]